MSDKRFPLRLPQALGQAGGLRDARRGARAALVEVHPGVGHHELHEGVLS